MPNNIHISIHHKPQVFGFMTLLDVGLNGFTIVNLCVMVRGNASSCWN